VTTPAPIGLVVPHPDDVLPPEAAEMYPDTRFLVRGTGVRALTPEGYDAAIDKVVPAALELAALGVAAIMVIGPSLTFYRGPVAHERLLERLRAETGLPVSTMSQAVVDALHELGARRVAVATAYTDVVNERLRDLLEHHGLEVAAIDAFHITEFGDGVIRRTPEEIVELAVGAAATADGADAVLVSCGGLQTLHAVVPIESRTGLPVVTSTQSALRDALRLAGRDARLAGLGRLLAG